MSDMTSDLLAALRFYGDPATYRAKGHPQIDADTAPINGDQGRRARDALALALIYTPKAAPSAPAKPDPDPMNLCIRAFTGRDPRVDRCPACEHGPCVTA
jgi:hypothetical protein